MCIPKDVKDVKEDNKDNWIVPFRDASIQVRIWKKTSKHHETGNISPFTPLFWEYLKTSEREQICVKVKTYFPEQRRSVWPLIPRADFKSHGLTLIGEEQPLPRAMTIDGFLGMWGLGIRDYNIWIVALQFCTIRCNQCVGPNNGQSANNCNYIIKFCTRLVHVIVSGSFDFVDDGNYSAL